MAHNRLGSSLTFSIARHARLLILGLCIAGLAAVFFGGSDEFAFASGGKKERRVWKLPGAEKIPVVTAMAVDRDGSIIVASGRYFFGRHQILRLYPGGATEVLAGTGRSTFEWNGEGQLATDVSLGDISNLAVLRNGDIMFLESFGAETALRAISARDHRVRTVLQPSYYADEEDEDFIEPKIGIHDTEETVHLCVSNMTVSNNDVLVLAVDGRDHRQKLWRLITEDGKWSVEPVAGEGNNAITLEPRPANEVALDNQLFLFSTHDGGFGLLAKGENRIYRGDRLHDGSFTLRAVAEDLPGAGELLGPPIETEDGKLVFADVSSHNLISLDAEEKAFTALSVPYIVEYEPHTPTSGSDESSSDQDESESSADAISSPQVDPFGIALPRAYVCDDGWAKRSDHWTRRTLRELAEQSPSGTRLSEARVGGRNTWSESAANWIDMAPFPGGGFLVIEGGFLRLIGPEQSDDALFDLIEEVLAPACDAKVNTGVRNYLRGVCEGRDRYHQFLDLHFLKLDAKDGDKQTTLFAQLPPEIWLRILSRLENNTSRQPVLRHLAASAVEILAAREAAAGEPRDAPADSNDKGKEEL